MTTTKFSRHGICAAFFLFATLSFSIQAAYTPLDATTFLTYLQTPNSNLILIDVRDNNETTQVIGTSLFHPYNLPWRDSTFNRNCTRMDTATTILIYCASGYRGGLAAQHLDSLGYRHVFNLTGGFNNWTGPKIAQSNIVPLSQFPTPSVHIRTAEIRHNTTAIADAPAKITIGRAGNNIGIVYKKHYFRINGTQQPIKNR